MNKETTFSRLFAHRGTACFFVMMLLFLSCALRTAAVVRGSYGDMQREQTSLKISLGIQRGTVFDCNMVPITNRESYTVAAVNPLSRAIACAEAIAEENSAEEIASLREGKAAVLRVKRKTECDGVAYATLYNHSASDMPAVHLVGYVDSTGHGVCGIEKAYDDFLYNEKPTQAVFSVSGSGSVLCGIAPEFENLIQPYSGGVVSTIDVNIQGIVEAAAKKFTCGAAVVSEISTGKLRAYVSLPDFDPTDISASLSAEGSPFLDRVCTPFSVGSVFKPCVAAAALESGKGAFVYNCTGSTYIIDRSFNCHKRDGHGEVDLQRALAFSCNTFFYNFAQYTGARVIYKTASALGFGSRLLIADNMTCPAGVLTEPAALENAAQLANLSIGQGSLLLPPLVMLNLYSAIGGGGLYYVPSAVEGRLENGRLIPYNYGRPTRAMSAETAQTLLSQLATVMTEGTAVGAEPRLVKAAGKTATAQTGRFDQAGREITNGWFCGVFPLEAPKYAVVVMSEGASAASDAEIFAEIADGITALENPDAGLDSIPE